MAQINIAQGETEAQRLWELMIKAKGGREALHKVNNILVQSNSRSQTTSGREYQHKRESLAVLPDKIWSYDDARPDVFGVTTYMGNYENMTEYFWAEGRQNVVAEPISSAYGRAMKAYQNTTIFCLSESRWLEPRVIDMKTDLVGSEKVFVIQTNVDGRRVDFAVSQKTYLPVKIILYEVGTNDPSRRDELLLSNYLEVEGIQVAQVEQFNRQGIETLKIRFNVEYDPSIFVRAPKKMGSNAWKLTQ